MITIGKFLRQGIYQFRQNLINIPNIESKNHRKIYTYPLLNAGHSKWANIKHTKALKDGQKAAIFQKLSRQIRLAIQDGGSPNPDVNNILKGVIEQAVRKGMPMATIQNVIKRSELSKTQMRKHILGIKAPNKIYMMCIIYTDNLTGLKGNLTPIIKKFGGLFANEPHLFEDHGIIEAYPDENMMNTINSETELEEICTEAAIECGAEEIEIANYETKLINFICRPESINTISNELTKKGYQIENSEHIFLPKMPIAVSENDLKLYEIFYNKLMAFEGIERIYDNLQQPES